MCMCVYVFVAVAVVVKRVISGYSNLSNPVDWAKMQFN